MVGRERIAALIPHAGSMCLLDEIVRWDDRTILCRSESHLALANPLRRDGRLHPLCGIEYGLQAAAAHGALRDGGRRRPGLLAALRDVVLAGGALDDPALGRLAIAATLELEQPGGTIYGFRVDAEGGEAVVSGRAVIRFVDPAG